MVAARPWCAAARAIDCPWLPRVALITPLTAGSRCNSSCRYTAPPRTLKAPTGVWFSCFTKADAPSRASSSGQRWVGVAAMCR